MNWLSWAILSAFFGGITAILSKLGVEEINSHQATAIRTALVMLFTWGVAAIANPGWQRISGRSWLFLTLSALVTAASWLCYFRALQLGDASKVAPVDKLSVVFVIALAAFFLKEKVSWNVMIGGALIVTGVLLIAWKPQ